MIVDRQDRLYLLTSHQVFRYLPGGQPDPAWTAVSVPENLVRMAVGPDGAAYATGYRAGNDTTGSELRIVRFLPDGARDVSYAPVYPVGGTIAGAPGISVGNRLILGGTIGTLSARLTPTGDRDASWDAMASPGGATAPAYDPYWFFAPDGRALVAGYAFDEGLGFSVLGQRWLLRLHDDGGDLGPLHLETPHMLNGNLVFQIPTQPGRTYAVQFIGALAGTAGPTADWTTRQTLTGDGTSQTVSLGTTGSVGFYRVMVSP